MPCDQHIETLARKILLHSRRRITHLTPLLLESIYALPEEVRPLEGPLSTDSRTLWFHPESVVADFRKDRDAVARQLLHVTLHCLLEHPAQRKDFPDERAFDCAADLKAAQLAEGLCGSAFALRDTTHFNSVGRVAHLHPLYQTLTQTPSNGSDRHHRNSLFRTAKTACFDDHSLWTPPPVVAVAAASNGSDSDGEGKGDPNGAASGTATTDNGPNWDAIRRNMLDGNGGQLPGDCAGMLTESFSVTDRGMSYADFLRRFAAPQERLLLDPDSFDIRWYYLGLETYGDIPLLEPSELSEPPVPDDIVIALDTSGSCEGEVCKRFLQETLGILRDISAGASRFRILLLQCDTRIQSEVLLETPEQVEELFQNFEARGFGGTDFRPVFQRVEELRRSGELPHIRGLLYLTDGYGDYPKQPADYPTAFLIPEDPRFPPEEVDWVTYLYLNDTDFTTKEASAT